MRITCQTVEDFLKNVESSTHIATPIHYDQNRNALNTDKSSWQVFYHLSTVIDYAGGEALVMCGVDCGTDRETADGELKGTEKQKELHKLVDSYCEKNGLVMLPGILDAS